MKNILFFGTSCVVVLAVCLSALWAHQDQTAVAAPRLSRSTQISLGSDHSCALLKTGVVKCWGG